MLLLEDGEEEEEEVWQVRMERWLARRWEEKKRPVLAVKEFYWDDGYYFHTRYCTVQVLYCTVLNCTFQVLCFTVLNFTVQLL